MNYGTRLVNRQILRNQAQEAAALLPSGASSSRITEGFNLRDNSRVVVSWMFPFQVSKQSHPAQHDSRSAEMVDSALDAAGIFHTEAISAIYTGGPDPYRDLTHHLNYSAEHLAQVGTGQPSEVDILLLREALDSLQNAVRDIAATAGLEVPPPLYGTSSH